jgi:predicted  nucleic acid-binding Zn-ribbon protein
MSELNPLPQGEDAGDLKSLSVAVARLSEKVALITEAVKNLSQNRTQLEGKIDEAQKRVQRILSRLPDQSDGRQLNLLGEVATPNNPEDDNEPTTH